VLRRFTQDDWILCVFYPTLSERETDYYYTRMDEVEEEVKNNALPSFPKKGPLCCLSFFVKKMKKNVVKNPSKNS